MSQTNTQTSFWMTAWGIACAVGVVGASILTGGLLVGSDTHTPEPPDQNHEPKRDPDVIVEIRHR